MAAGRHSSLVLRAAAQGTEGVYPSPEAAVVAAERRTELFLAVEGLGEADREAIACRYFLGLSEEETAAALGCARGTVKSRLSRALGRLREKMTEEEDAAG